MPSPAPPTLNLNGFITGQGNIWDGPPPEGLKGVKAPASPPRPELFNQLLIQKLGEMSRELKALDPEAYRRLRLEELVGKGDGKA